MNHPWRVLVVPCAEEGRGSGHLKRSFALVRGLRGAGGEAFLYLPGGPGARSLQDLLSAFPGEFDPGDVFSGDPGERTWTFVLLDRYRTPRAEFRRWASLAPVVGVDEGGVDRRAFDYLLDLLPATAARERANEVDPGLLPLPTRHRPPTPSPRTSPPRALVSFGGEDATGLSSVAARSLLRSGTFEVDVLRGALALPDPDLEELVSRWPGACRLLGPLPDLRERLADYDLVVTLFGLTALEASHAGVPVLLVSPTRLHETLARKAGFFSAGVGRGAAARVGSLAEDSLDLIASRSQAAAPRRLGRSYSERIASIAFPSGVSCPLCSKRSLSPVLGRFPDRSYRRCPECGMLYLVRTCPPPIVYQTSYFFEDYKRQYGVTYLEDFPNLERAGRARASRILDLLPSGPTAPRVLDVGCAYGPFLSAARQLGFDPYGVDPAQDAVTYVRERLGIPAAAGFFPDFDPEAAFGGRRVPPFDALTLWYVIEHFPHLAPVLESANRLLPPGGVLAFSTPSGGGISARSRFVHFLEHSPQDHYSIWEPRLAARHLARYGFRLEKIVVSGHHPERFPGLSQAAPGSLFYRLADRASRAFGLGDTFEVYAIKERSLP